MYNTIERKMYMSDILLKIDGLFKDGFINSVVSVAIVLIFLLFINAFLFIFIKTKWEKQYPLLRRIKRTILYTIAIVSVLAQFKGLNSILSGLLASGGVLAVILGLASQEVASDILSGIMIVLYKPYKIGDFIFVSEHNVKGTVLDISVRHTIIETNEKTQITVPNTVMNKAIVENISNVSSQKNNYLFVDVAYDCDIDKAIAIIQKEGMKHPFFVDARSKEDIKNNVPAIKVHCIDFKESAIGLRASIYSKDNASGFQMLSDLRMSILKRFEEENIEIPFPYRVVINK